MYKNKDTGLYKVYKCATWKRIHPTSVSAKSLSATSVSDLLVSTIRSLTHTHHRNKTSSAPSHTPSVPGPCTHTHTHRTCWVPRVWWNSTRCSWNQLTQSEDQLKEREDHSWQRKNNYFLFFTKAK